MKNKCAEHTNSHTHTGWVTWVLLVLHGEWQANPCFIHYNPQIHPLNTHTYTHIIHRYTRYKHTHYTHTRTHTLAVSVCDVSVSDREVCRVLNIHAALRLHQAERPQRVCVCARVCVECVRACVHGVCVLIHLQAIHHESRWINTVWMLLIVVSAAGCWTQAELDPWETQNNIISLIYLHTIKTIIITKIIILRLNSRFVSLCVIWLWVFQLLKLVDFHISVLYYKNLSLCLCLSISLSLLMTKQVMSFYSLVIQLN